VRGTPASVAAVGPTPAAPSTDSTGTDRVVLSTRQGVITGDNVFDAVLAPEWTSAT